MARTRKSISFLDTHIVCWLFEGKTELLSSTAADRLEHDDLLISPIVEMELQYLYEIGRIALPPAEVLGVLASDIGLQIADIQLSKIVAASLLLNWTRDPFDRLIVAHTQHDGAHLITRDRTIQQHFPQALW